MDTESLLNKLFKLEYVSNMCGDRTTLKVIGDYAEKKTLVRNAVEAWKIEQEAERDAKIAALEAKVYTYEKIIANSNFKPLLEERSVENG